MHRNVKENSDPERGPGETQHRLSQREPNSQGQTCCRDRPPPAPPRGSGQTGKAAPSLSPCSPITSDSHCSHPVPAGGKPAAFPASPPAWDSGATLHPRHRLGSPRDTSRCTGTLFSAECSPQSALSLPLCSPPCDSFSLLLCPGCRAGLDLLPLCIGQSCCGTSTIAIMSCIKNSLFFYTLFFPGGTLFLFLSVYFQCLLLMSQCHEKTPLTPVRQRWGSEGLTGNVCLRVDFHRYLLGYRAALSRSAIYSMGDFSLCCLI